MTDTPQGPASRSTPQGAEGGVRYAAPPAGAADQRGTHPTAWRGWVVFAGVMMVLIGTFQAIAGLVALFRNTYYLVTSSGLLITLDYTTWGWVHLILGVIVAAAGVAVMQGRTWGRVVGVALAGLSALLNLFFLAAYPLWSLIVIAMDVLVIFALIVHGSETKPEVTAK